MHAQCVQSNFTFVMFSIEQGKCDKQTCTFRFLRLDFIPFYFSTFASFDLGVHELFLYIYHYFYSHAHGPEWEAHDLVFYHLSPADIRGVINRSRKEPI